MNRIANALQSFKSIIDRLVARIFPPPAIEPPSPPEREMACFDLFGRPAQVPLDPESFEFTRYAPMVWEVSEALNCEERRALVRVLGYLVGFMRPDYPDEVDEALAVGEAEHLDRGQPF